MLTLQFVPHYEIAVLSEDKKIDLLLSIVKENRIVVLEGKLKKKEEMQLIKRTMEEIDERFKGIETSELHSNTKDQGLMDKLKNSIVEMLAPDRQGVTIIGPASVIKEIKRDPNRIQLVTEAKNK